MKLFLKCGALNPPERLRMLLCSLLLHAVLPEAQRRNNEALMQRLSVNQGWLSGSWFGGT